MTRDLDALLAQFKDEDPTVRMLRAVMRAIPGNPEIPPWRSLEQAVKAMDASASPAVVARARALSQEESVRTVLGLADALDSSDAVVSILTSVGTALRLHKARKVQVSDMLGLEQKQASDAVLKALALAAIVGRLFPGTESDRVAALQDRIGGRALLAWFFGLELALPFGEEAWSKEGSILGAILPDIIGDSITKLSRSVGPDTVEEAQRVLPVLVPVLDGGAQAIQGRIDSLADAVISHLPGAQRFMDLMGDVVALGADAFPVYRMLVPRLVAEVCARRALDEREGRVAEGPLYEPLPSPVPEPVQAPPPPAPPGPAAPLPAHPSAQVPSAAPTPWAPPPVTSAPPAPAALAPAEPEWPSPPAGGFEGFQADISGPPHRSSSDLVFAEPPPPPSAPLHSSWSAPPQAGQHQETAFPPPLPPRTSAPGVMPPPVPSAPSRAAAPPVVPPPVPMSATTPVVAAPTPRPPAVPQPPLVPPTPPRAQSVQPPARPVAPQTPPMVAPAVPVSRPAVVPTPQAQAPAAPRPAPIEGRRPLQPASSAPVVAPVSHYRMTPTHIDSEPSELEESGDTPKPKKWMKWAATSTFVLLVLGCSGVLLIGGGGVAVYVAQSMGYYIQLPSLPF